MSEVQIEIRVTVGEYVRLIYLLTYRRWPIIFITVVGAINLLLGIFRYFGVIQYSDSPFVGFVFGLVICILIPVSIYFTATKQFKSHLRIQEKIIYTFTPQHIQIDGESFNTSMTWDKCYKVLETKFFFLIYQNKAVANFVGKKNFSQDQIIALREIIRSIPGLKSRLKKL